MITNVLSRFYESQCIYLSSGIAKIHVYRTHNELVPFFYRATPR